MANSKSGLVTNRVNPGFVESVLLYALLTAVTGLSLDIVLPAYAVIAESFPEAAVTDLQNNILLFVAGMLVGEIVSGIFADRYGRRKIMVLSLAVFALGTGLCIIAQTYDWLIVGRIIQGAGAAGQKICTRAIIRDRFQGVAMARVMSFVLAAFVVLPFIAPAIGAYLSHNFGWQSIYVFLACYGLFVFIWFFWRQPETLSVTAGHHSLSFGKAIAQFFRCRTSTMFTLVAGILFGVHLALLSLSPILFDDLYGIVREFPLYFGSMACAFGVALMANAKYVSRVGMSFIVWCGLSGLGVVQVLFAIVVIWIENVSFPWFFSYAFALLFFLGLIFGNLTSLIMQPLGNMAGVGGALSASLSTAVALLVSSGVGFLYQGDLRSFVLPLAACGLMAIGIASVSVRPR